MVSAATKNPFKSRYYRSTNIILLCTVFFIGLFLILSIQLTDNYEEFVRKQPTKRKTRVTAGQKNAAVKKHKRRRRRRRGPCEQDAALMEPKQTSNRYETDEQLEFWVRRYMRWHDANRHNASRVAIFMPVKYGFGDNVKGMVHMFAYAVLTKRLFLMDIADYPISKLISANARRRFVYNGNEYGQRKDWVGPKIRTGCVNAKTRTELLPLKARKLLRENNPVVGLHVGIIPLPHEVQNSLGRRDKIPAFSLAVGRAIADMLLEPNSELRSAQKAQAKQLQFCNSGTVCSDRRRRHYIAVHARLGGVGELRHVRFRKMRNKYDTVANCLAKAVQVVIRKNNIKEPRVFLATDLLTFRETFERSMKPIDVRWLNIKNMVHFSNSNDFRVHFEIQLDNLMIANAQHIIALKSGFSDIAYWRGNASSIRRVRKPECGIPEM